MEESKCSTADARGHLLHVTAVFALAYDFHWSNFKKESWLSAKGGQAGRISGHKNTASASLKDRQIQVDLQNEQKMTCRMNNKWLLHFALGLAKRNVSRPQASVCLSVCTAPHSYISSCTQKYFWEWHGLPSSCALLGGFAIGAQVSLLWQHTCTYNATIGLPYADNTNTAQWTDKVCLHGHKIVWLEIMKLTSHKNSA